MTALTKKEIIRALRDDETGTPAMIYEDNTCNFSARKVTTKMTHKLQGEGYLAVSPGDYVYIRADLVEGNTHVHESLRR